MSKKILFLDLDGTLLDSKKNISDCNIACIDRLKEIGWEIVIASGRHFREIKNYLNILKLDDKKSSIIISSDGQYLCDSKGKIIWNASFLKFDDIIKIINLNSNVDMFIFTDKEDILITPDIKKIIKMKLKGIFNIIRNRPKFVYHNKNIKKIKKNLCIEKIRILIEKNKFYNFDLYENYSCYFYDKFVDIKAYNVNKYEAICKYIEIKKESFNDVVFIGDDYNDIECFKNIKHTYVMENAVNDVKKYARYKTKSNDEDGVYWALKKFLI